MLKQAIESLKDPVTNLADIGELEGGLLSELQVRLELIMRKYGYDPVSGQSIADYFEQKLSEQKGQHSSELVDDIIYVADIIEGIRLELGADEFVPGQAATRWGVSQHTISQTLRDTANYIIKQNIGSEHTALVKGWLEPGGLLHQIENASQEELRQIFGKGDRQNYYPGRMIPTLIAIRETLHFLAYRESLTREHSDAQKLIDEIDAFKGCYGNCHMACSSISRERDEFIERSQRHPAERYVDVQNAKADSMNSANFAYNWTENKWIAVDADTIECRISMRVRRSYSNVESLAFMKSSFIEGFERGGITDSKVSIELGETYGEDAIVIQLNREQYLEKLVEIKLGKRKIDSSSYNSSFGISDPSISDLYLGYEPEKDAFYGPQGFYVKTIRVEEAYASNDKVSQKISWLRGTEVQKEARVFLPKINGAMEEYTIFSEKPPRYSESPYVVEGRYWDDLELGNEMNALRQDLYGLINDVSLEGSRTTPERNLNSNWHEYEGRVYIPYNEPFKQVAYHFQHTYGLKFGIHHLAGSSKELTALLENDTHMVLLIDRLPSVTRGAVREALCATLERVQDDLCCFGDGMLELVST